MADEWRDVMTGIEARIGGVSNLVPFPASRRIAQSQEGQ